MNNQRPSRRDFLIGAGTVSVFGLSKALHPFRGQAANSEKCISDYLRLGMAGDDALRSAARDAVSSGNVLIVDVPVIFSQRWRPPVGLVLRGDRSAQATLKWKGRGDAIEICGPIQLDGITVDGGADLSGPRTSELQSSLLSIHGSVAGTPAYLSDIRIGWLCVQRTRSVGLVIANVQGLRAGNIVLQHIYCAGLMLSGVRDSVIESVFANNIGDLEKIGGRRGSAVCVFTDTKPVAKWYDDGRILPTNSLSFGEVQIHNTTDSAFYIHDDRKTGVNDICIDWTLPEKMDSKPETVPLM